MGTDNVSVETVVAGPADEGLRLDVWLHRRLPALSRARVQALLREGWVSAVCCVGRLRPGATVHPGLRVDVSLPPVRDAVPLPERIPLDVLYEDGDLIVVNKPAGMVVHPAAGHDGGTLVNALLHRCGDLGGIGGERRPGIVHRLDKDTSGAIVAAKNEPTLNGLAEQFRSGGVRKVYLALIRGAPRPPAGRIETLIGRSAGDRKKMSARIARGRNAITHYEVAEQWADAALVRVRIETGRTHQIRVHMAHIGHPVLGDRQYGARATPERLRAVCSRQMLHAAELAFRHPRTGVERVFRAPVPDDFQRALDVARTPAVA